MDRIDIQLEVPAVPFKDLAAEHAGPSSAQVRADVLAARHIQLRRFKGSKVFANAQMSTRQTRNYCALDAAELGLLERAMHKFKLSARAYGRILKIARTIADLEGTEKIGMSHLSEAIGYRSLDRGLA
jgi:magnesium chelatase family protein